MTFTYAHARPSVTVDVALVGFDDTDVPKVLLIRRGRPGTPFEGCWALPGGFVDENEDLLDAARREMREETQVELKDLRQVGAFGKPGRDPRGHVISVAFLAAIEMGSVNPVAADDARDVAWHPLNNLPPLAFDHGDIIAAAMTRMYHDFLVGQHLGEFEIKHLVP
jgi:8-oxo-dGTP diphosphatase